jgi:SAM-dependent methyltransferase
MIFNRLATPSEFGLDGCLLHQHQLVTEETLRGQHPIRAWEYSQALWALEEWDSQQQHQLTHRDEDYRSWLIADVGGAGSNFWKCLHQHTRRPIYRIDPDHEWERPEDASRVFRQTLSQFWSEPPGHAKQMFDAVFCISVIEHVPAVMEFERDLVALVRPGGLLVLTTDAAPSYPDVYHFHWMRKRIYVPDGLIAMEKYFGTLYGLEPLTPVSSWTWEGPTLYDYTVASAAFVKKLPVEKME